MKYLIPVLLLTLMSCAGVPQYDNYIGFEECSNAQGFYLYPTDDTTSDAIVFVPANTTMYTRTKHSHKYIKLYYGSHHGFAYNHNFKHKRVWHQQFPVDLATEQDRTFESWLSQFAGNDTSTKGNKSGRTYNSGSSGGPVHVRGYYRSNGTYVQPHTRSAPSRRH